MNKKLLLSLLLIIVVVTNISAVELSKKFMVLAEQGEQKLQYSLTDKNEKKLTFKWVVDNPNVLELEVAEDNSALVKTRAKGRSFIYVCSEENPEILDKCQVVVNKDGVIKILAIGNSFSEDAVEQYLHELAIAEDIPNVIGNMYIGGCPLELHHTNIVNNKDAYFYRKIDLDGVKTETKNVSIDVSIADEDWDSISIQQASGFSGLYETYEKDLPFVMAHIRKQATNKNVVYLLHATWAYAKDSKHEHFVFYDNSQEKMYKSIVESAWRAKNLVGIDYLIPSGTAIQNARTTDIDVEKDFCRDGYHLNYDFGRYTAACTWFYRIFGVDVRKNSYKPDKVSSKEASVARNAAYTAILNPFFVTNLKVFMKTHK